MSKRPCDTVVIHDIMEKFEESVSLYHCIRIVYDPTRGEEDQLMLCDTRIAIFTMGDKHSFKHSMGTGNVPVVWTAPDWTHHDISEYYANPSNQKLLEPDDPCLDTFYIICRDRPTPLSRSQEVGKSKNTSFMDHVEDMVKTSVESARFVRERSEDRVRNNAPVGKVEVGKAGKGKGYIFTSKKSATEHHYHPTSEEMVKAHLVKVILPYICHLCKNPSEDDMEYKHPPDGRFTNRVDNTALVYVSEASVTG